MSELKLKNVFFNDSTDPNSEAKHIFDEVNESLKDHPISSVKNLKKYFRLLAKKFAENLNRELAHIFNHPNILDYKNVSFDPHSRAEYKNENLHLFITWIAIMKMQNQKTKMMLPYHSNFILTFLSNNCLKLKIKH